MRLRGVARVARRGGRALSAPGRPRSPAALALGSLLALLWFSAMFFALFPALVLWASGAPLWPPPPGASRWLGGAILAGALALLVAPVRAFVVLGRGTQLPLAPPGTLVAQGPFARVRNPMYTLYVAIVFGLAVLFRSLALVVYALGFAALVHVYVVRHEEPVLRRRFGAAYDAYCRETGRWLPRRRRAG